MRAGRPASAGSTPARGRRSGRRPATGGPGWCWRAAGSARRGRAAEWVRHRVETGAARRIALVGATAADVRDVMVEGPSGLLAVCPPWDRPRYEPQQAAADLAQRGGGDDLLRRRARPVAGAAASTAPGSTSWRRSATRRPWTTCCSASAWATIPRLCVTTTPKPVRLVTDLVADPTTAIARGTTYENRAHLASSFFERIVRKYEGTRLGQQELLAEILEVRTGRGSRRSTRPDT